MNCRKMGKAGGKESMREIFRVVRHMGITAKYKGYYYVAEAVNMTIEQQGKPIRITKDIYPRLARKFKST